MTFGVSPECMCRGYKRAISLKIDRLSDNYTEAGYRELEVLLDMHEFWHATWKNAGQVWA